MEFRLKWRWKSDLFCSLVVKKGEKEKFLSKAREDCEAYINIHFLAGVDVLRQKKPFFLRPWGHRLSCLENHLLEIKSPIK